MECNPVDGMQLCYQTDKLTAQSQTQLSVQQAVSLASQAQEACKCTVSARTKLPSDLFWSIKLLGFLKGSEEDTPS